MKTIYVYGKPVVLCRTADEALPHALEEAQLIRLKEPDPGSMPGLLQSLRDGAAGYIWESDAPERLMERLSAAFTLIRAGGGVVRDTDGNMLLIFRQRHWDLPKGKQDEGEDIRDCALREVREETGLQNLRITEELGDTWHTYERDGKSILKQTSWFGMLFTGTELTIPQIEEDITDIQWISPANVHRYMPFMFPNVRDVLRRW
ncbi:NUDIX hydrolase [Compostibacter hankyongensis]|uniref:Nudix hydrolase domain-containing protein n=1 Tax=Compostibacter hankyongensis TaxID=1007089 RepID=A0ABP8G3A1_9BACT